MSLFRSKKPPSAPTAGDLYSGPSAQWGQYDPNTATSAYARPMGLADARTGATQARQAALRSDPEWSAWQASRQTTTPSFQQQARTLTGANNVLGMSDEEIRRRYPSNADALIRERAAAQSQFQGMPAGPGSRSGAPAATTRAQVAPQATEWQRQVAQNAIGGSSRSPIAMAQVRGDQQGMDAARQALATLQQVGREGWTPVDRLALAAAQRQSARGEQAQRGALMQQAQARGLGGSALGFGGALQAQQGAADRANDYASQIAIAGRDRALGATQASANLGMGIDDVAFSQAAQRAAAVDAANQWFTGRQDEAAAQAYQAQLGAWQLGEQQRQARLQALMGGISGAFGAGMDIAGLVKGGG